MKRQKNLFELFDSIGNLGEIILVLRSLEEGCIEKWALKSSIYRQSGVSAKIPNADTLIEISLDLGMIEREYFRKKELIALSSSGRELIGFKYIEKDRLTEEQGKLLFLKIIEKSNNLPDVLSVINIFNTDTNGRYWIETGDKRINLLEDKILRLLQQLRIARFIDGNIIIEKQEKEWLTEILGTGMRIDKENLLKILEQRNKHGVIAEEFVLQVEKERLADSGRNDLADLVRRISDENVAAGYDILSFDGPESGVSPDRFIEVKGNSANQILFYITRNELEMARRMRNKYWVYCVLNVESIKSRKLEMFQDPYKSIFQTKKLEVEPVLWKVSK